MPSFNCLQSLSTNEALIETWKSLFAETRSVARNTAGFDGVSINDFAIDYKPRIRELAAKLRGSRFSFHPLKPHLLPKPGGKHRLICVPTVEDRIVQRALLHHLSQRYNNKLANQISYGFIRGRTVQKAAQQACAFRQKHPWVLKTDICSFFDKINRDLLSREIKRTIRERSLHDILIAAASCEIAPTSRANTKRITQMGIQEGIGVRQGMPLSPIFSNLLLLPFDQAIQDQGLRALRYADDLIFFTDSYDECIEALAACKNLLNAFDLSLPGLEAGSKTTIYEPDEAAEFLGLGICKTSIGYSLSLLPDQKNKIRAQILSLGSVSELLARKITLSTLSQAINNRIAGYLAAYHCCDNINEVENELKALGKKVRRRILQDELHIRLEHLSAEARTFLDL